MTQLQIGQRVRAVRNMGWDIQAGQCGTVMHPGIGQVATIEWDCGTMTGGSRDDLEMLPPPWHTDPGKVALLVEALSDRLISEQLTLASSEELTGLGPNFAVRMAGVRSRAAEKVRRLEELRAEVEGKP